MRKALILALLVATAATSSLCAKQPETVSGIAKVVDGDSLEIGAVRIRLFGIDAPEGRQLCTRDSASWSCGTAAADKLRALIGGNSIDCVQRDVDQYKRVVAICKNGATDLGAPQSRHPVGAHCARTRCSRKRRGFESGAGDRGPERAPSGG